MEQYSRKKIEGLRASYYVAGAFGALQGNLEQEDIDRPTYLRSRRIAMAQPTERSLEIARSSLVPVMWELTEKMQFHSRRLKSLHRREVLLLDCVKLYDDLIVDFKQGLV